MAVRHDIYEPKDKAEIDPKAKITEEKDDAEKWKARSEAARAKREFEEEERKAERARTMEDNPPEAPFKIGGEIKLGTIDLQEQQRELKATLAEIQQDAQEKMEALRKESADYRERVHEIQLNMVENTLKAQIEALQRSIQEGLSKPKEPALMDQIGQIEKFADILGYRKPTEEMGLPSEVRLKMLEMELNEKAKAREFELHLKESERLWQLKLKEIEQQAASQSALIQQEREKRSMWVSPFEAIGQAIARGLIDSGGQIPEPTRTKSKMKKAPDIILDAEEGESGVIDCPQCQEQIAIAPSARSAVCPSCETTFPINRKSKA